jgi:hypothetical protein
MFDEKDLRPTHCVTTVEKLLWNINENLVAIRAAAEKPAFVPEDSSGTKYSDGPGIPSPEPKKCPKCDFTYTEQAEYMRHCKTAHPKDTAKG